RPRPTPAPFPYTTLFRSVVYPLGRPPSPMGRSGRVGVRILNTRRSAEPSARPEGSPRGPPPALRGRRATPTGGREGSTCTRRRRDRKSTRLNSSHVKISY